MMYVIHGKLNEPLECGDKAQILVIENPKEFRRWTEEIKKQISTGEGGFTVYDEKQKEYAFSSACDVIVDYIGLTLNSKKIISGIYKRIENEYMKYGNYEKLSSANEKVYDLLDEIIFMSDFELEYETKTDVSGYMKLFNMKVKEEYDELKEKIVSYIDLMSEFQGLKIIIAINLKSYMDEKETEEIYKHCLYKGIGVLDIESRVPETVSPNEKVRVIDKDLCEFRLEK